MPDGERASRARCLLSVSKRPDEISENIQHLVPVSGSLLWSLNINRFVQKSFETAAALSPGTYVWGLITAQICTFVGGIALVRGLNSQMTYCEGLFRLHPLFTFSLNSQADFWQLADRGNGTVSDFLLLPSNKISSGFLKTSLLWPFHERSAFS